MTSASAGVARTRVETFLERHAWKVLLCISVVIGYFGAGDVIASASNLQYGEAALMHSLVGTSWNELQAANPGAANLIDWKFRSEGGTLLTLGVVLIAVCLTGFRRGERWAWYALWAIPLWLVLGIVSLLRAVRYSGYGTPVPVISGSVFLVLRHEYANCPVCRLGSTGCLRMTTFIRAAWKWRMVDGGQCTLGGP